MTRANFENVGENVEMTVDVDASELRIIVDTAHRGSRSASGKTIRIASTMGNHKMQLPDGTTIWVGLNIYTK